MGLPWQDGDYENLNYRSDGDLDVGLLFTTDHLATITDWYDDLPYSGFENSFDSFYENGMNNLYLQFEIYWNDDINDIYNLQDENNEIRCLVCMNVGEDSELKEGDKGFGACYRPFEGNFFK